MSTDQFERISSKFNSTFVPETSAIEVIENRLTQISNRKTDLVQATKSENVLKDQQYLSEEIYQLIADTKEVMTMLKETIKEGSRASLFEAYSKLANSVTDQLTELRELNKIIADMEMFKNNANPPVQQTTIIMSGTDMLEKLLEARKNAEINTIEVDFSVEE